MEEDSEKPASSETKPPEPSKEKDGADAMATGFGGLSLGGWSITPAKSKSKKKKTAAAPRPAGGETGESGKAWPTLSTKGATVQEPPETNITPSASKQTTASPSVKVGSSEFPTLQPSSIWQAKTLTESSHTATPAFAETVPDSSSEKRVETGADEKAKVKQGSKNETTAFPTLAPSLIPATFAPTPILRKEPEVSGKAAVDEKVEVKDNSKNETMDFPTLAPSSIPATSAPKPIVLKEQGASGTVATTPTETQPSLTKPAKVEQVSAPKPIQTSMSVATTAAEIIAKLSKPALPKNQPRDSRGKGQKRPKRPDPNFLSNQVEKADFVNSRSSIEGVLQTKKGESGEKVEFISNYFPLLKLTNFNLFHYHVEFKPDEERTEVRKKLLKIHEPNIGACIFDGQALYTPNRILGITALYSMNTFKKQKTQITLKLVAEIIPVDPIFLQVYNIIFRTIMTSMGLELMGRFYYDPAAKLEIPARKLEVWPGYITSVRNHENELLLNLELTHKVVRSDSVLDFLKNLKQSGAGNPRFDYKFHAKKQLLGTIILTSYNKKTYAVDEINWEVSPSGEFKLSNGDKKSYKDYYYENYGVIIKDKDQPMLVSLPKKKDYHRGCTQPIFLIPELCQMTGLSESMRKDVSLMKDLSRSLVLSPAERVTNSIAFIERLYKSKSIKEQLSLWNIEISRSPTRCNGRIVPMEELYVGGRGGVATKVKQDKPGDWTNIFKARAMLTTVALRQWVLILSPQCEKMADQFMTTLKTTARAMNFLIENPMFKFSVTDTKPGSYATAIHNIHRQLKKVQMYVVILSNNGPEAYSVIKRKCYCELGVASQCIVLKTLQHKNPLSITSRVAIQMNAKLGGEPWTVNVPLKDLMIVGYDVFHSGNKRAPSVGALVASISPTIAKYFTKTCFHKNRNELSANLCAAMIEAILTFSEYNDGRLPARIIFYRDGVGDGQLTYIYNTELNQIKEALDSVYTNSPTPRAKFTFIVVTKRIHTRIFKPTQRTTGNEMNPPPGTIVDDVITMPERFDFFLISQTVTNNGAVSPTSYNVLYDEQGLGPDKIQRLTFKLCHLYFNFTGTIAVPAPCQYAHKLAYLTGTNTHQETHKNLTNFLYFL